MHSDHHLLEQEATQILALDQSPFSVNLFPQHEVAFPVHHQLLVNLLEFELVVSVVAVAVVLDLVSTLDAYVLVVVLVHRVSSVVLVLGETVVVVDPCVIAVSMVATRTVVTHVVSAADTLSAAAVVSDPLVWVHPSQHKNIIHHTVRGFKNIQTCSHHQAVAHRSAHEETFKHACTTGGASSPPSAR